MSDTWIDKLKNIGNLGGFGDIVFTVLPWKTMTFKDAEHSSGVEYHEHKVINEKPKLEFLYKNADEVTVNILLKSMLGVNPKAELKQFEEYMNNGDIYDLIIGNGLEQSNVLGEFVINGLSRSYKEVSFWGEVTEIDLKVTFKEFN